MSDNKSSSNGLGFGSVLFLIFLTLKLANVINWSWWWVTAPLWGGFAIVAAIALIAMIVLILKQI